MDFFYRWSFRTNHKDIGTLYFFLGILTIILGTLLSLTIWIELRYPTMNFIAGNVYNVLIITQVLTIIFFFVIPLLMIGFWNWLLPLILGCSDIIFLRLNNLSFWLLPLSFLLLLLRILVGGGGIIYPPLRDIFEQPGIRVDLIIISFHIVIASSIMWALIFFYIITNSYNKYILFMDRKFMKVVMCWCCFKTTGEVPLEDVIEVTSDVIEITLTGEKDPGGSLDGHQSEKTEQFSKKLKKLEKQKKIIQAANGASGYLSGNDADREGGYIPTTRSVKTTFLGIF